MFGFRNKNCETTKANSPLAGKPTKTSVAGDVSVSRFESSVEVSAASLLLDKPYLCEGGGGDIILKNMEQLTDQNCWFRCLIYLIQSFVF